MVSKFKIGGKRSSNGNFLTYPVFDRMKSKKARRENSKVVKILITSMDDRKVPLGRTMPVRLWNSVDAVSRARTTREPDLGGFSLCEGLS